MAEIMSSEKTEEGESSIKMEVFDINSPQIPAGTISKSVSDGPLPEIEEPADNTTNLTNEQGESNRWFEVMDTGGPQKLPAGTVSKSVSDSPLPKTEGKTDGITNIPGEAVESNSCLEIVDISSLQKTPPSTSAGPQPGIEKAAEGVPNVSVARNVNSDQKDVSMSKSPSPTVADMLCDFTHRAIGISDQILPCLSLVASKPKLAWLHGLETQGYAGLLYVDITSLENQPGCSLSWWLENRSSIDRRLVKTPLEETAASGIFTAKNTLPSSSLVNSVMCTIAELIGSEKGTKYFVTTAQMFLASSGGFSQDFRHENTNSDVTSDGFRCFWYFGPTESDKQNNESCLPTSPEHEAVFIGSAGTCTKVFGTDRVVTLDGFFGEADRKFRLHSGDILIMRYACPFAVDLPVGGRAKGGRVISWLVLPEKEDTRFPVIMPMSEMMMSIDMVISTSKDALEYRNKEFDNLEITPGAPGDPYGHMQRFRVTPGKYSCSEILEEVENNERILYIDNIQHSHVMNQVSLQLL